MSERKPGAPRDVAAQQLRVAPVAEAPSAGAEVATKMRAVLDTPAYAELSRKFSNHEIDQDAFDSAVADLLNLNEQD